jgi:hypothetical protein
MRWPQDHTGGGEVDALEWVLSGGRISAREPRIAGSVVATVRKG